LRSWQINLEHLRIETNLEKILKLQKAYLAPDQATKHPMSFLVHVCRSIEISNNIIQLTLNSSKVQSPILQEKNHQNKKIYKYNYNAALRNSRAFSH
jgi:hypothetical protein